MSMNRRRFLAGLGAAAATAAVGVPAVAEAGPWGTLPTLAQVLAGELQIRSAFTRTMLADGSWGPWQHRRVLARDGIDAVLRAFDGEGEIIDGIPVVMARLPR